MATPEVATPEVAAQTVAASPLSAKLQERKIDICDGGDMQLALLTPTKSPPRLRSRSTVKINGDGDFSSTPSKAFGKTAWTQKDTLDLIDAVKTVEDNQLLTNHSGRLSKKGQRAFQGDKWQQVAALLPNCWMSSSDRFNVICRGKYQELRRNYQAMLRNNSTRKFFSDEICQKMKDYIEDVPPLRFLEGGVEDSKRPLLLDNGCSSLVPKTKCVEDLKSPNGLEVADSRVLNSNCSESGQRLRRSSRTVRRSCYLEFYSEQDDMTDTPSTFVSPDSRSSRNSRLTTPTIKKGQANARKRAKLEASGEHDEQVETISELFKKNFELLRSNIDFSTEFHLHKHLHKHFKAFEDHMTGLIQKIDQKIDRLDQKVEEKMGSSNLPL